MPKFAFASTNGFISSIGFDHRLAPYDLTASIAHVRMLGRQGIISRKDAAKIAGALQKLLAEARRGRKWRGEDIHTAIEEELHKRLGPVAGKVHTARSRNDQVVTAVRLYLRDHIDQIDARLKDIARAFVEQSEKNQKVLMPGFTHLQPAQPIRAAHHLLTYAWMFQRDRERLRDLRRRVNQLPLGAAALAGTTFPIDRAWVAKQLGFEGLVENSLDAVSDRDFLVEFAAAAALISAHLSRWAEELMIWTSPAWGFATLADPYVSGSSIMPQKRNPDVAEIMRGKTGRVYGSLVALLTLVKAQPLAYNRDLQEDKPPLFDAVETVLETLDVAVPMARTMVLDGGRMRAACAEGFLLATDVADALVRRGLPFRQAHEIVAAVVRYARERRQTLEDIPLSVWTSHSPLFGPWLRDALSLESAVEARASRGGTALSSVKRQWAMLKKLTARALPLVAGLALGAQAQAPRPVEQTLTLQESIQRALQNNQSLLSAQEDTAIARHRQRESKAPFYPEVGVNMNASRYLAEQYYVLPSEFGSTLLRPSGRLEADNFYAARAWMRQPLYNGGRFRNNYLLAQANLERARIQEEEIRSQAVVDVTKAFYDLLLSRQKIDSTENALGTVDSMVRRLSGSNGVGRAQALSVQAALRRRLAEDKRTAEKAYLEYLDNLGVELYTTVGLEGKLEATPVSMDLAKLLAWAQESRLEIRRTSYQQEIDRLAVNLSQAERYPIVAFGASYEMNDAEFPLQTTHWNTTLNVSLPIFDGFASRSRIRQRRHQANQSRILRAEVEDKIQAEVRDSYTDVVYWQQELEPRNAERKKAKDAADAVERGSDYAGRAQAEAWLLDAEEAYWTAVHGHKVALAKLEKAVGRPLKDPK